MSWVREKAYSAAFDKTTLIPSPAFEFSPPANSEEPSNTDSATSTSTRELEILTERERPSRRNLLASMVLGLGLGLFLPIALFLPLYRSTQGSAAELPKDVGIHVSVSGDLAENLTIDSKPAALAKEIRAGSDQMEHEVPSDNAQFATEQPVSLQPREYLSIRSAPRLYQPEMILSPIDGGAKESKVTAEDLKILSGSAGRFKARNGKSEWQGRWSFENTEQNLKNGLAYSDYLDKAFDSSFGNKLSVINARPSSLLTNVERSAAGPTGIGR